MTNFPYISWWQTKVHVVIEFLHKSENPFIEKKDNILIFKDTKYDLQLDLLHDFKIEGLIPNPQTIKIFLFKLEDLNWNKLLKNEAKYKYFISTDWDKLLDEEEEEEENINKMMQSFDPGKLNSEQLDNLMKNMHNNELIVPDFDNPCEEQDEILEETQEEDSPINVKTFDLDNIDETTENCISNLDI